jgi:orotidine-5'-phosphate decarboxylase
VIENRDKLICALDFPAFEDAKIMIDELSDEVNFYKIGLEMMMSGDYFKTIKFLKKKNKKVFADLKLYDIPQTIAGAVSSLSEYEIDFLTIHSANKEIMSRAVENKGHMKIIAVTILTCFEKNDLIEVGFDKSFSTEDLVLKKAKLALESGVDGVVSSGLDAKNLREKLGDNFLIITPGIRLKKTNDDQKRTFSVKMAILGGASHIVVGRPITKDKNPIKIARKINEIINYETKNR